MLKSKRATVTNSDLNYEPRVVHLDARNQIIHVDREVATLLG
jgi:aspartate 1-decarboxylase